MKEHTDHTLLSLIYTHFATIKKVAHELKELKAEAKKRKLL
ncbi:MAG: hypothetical protein WBI40_09540 [Methylococcaceae bacterium]